MKISREKFKVKFISFKILELHYKNLDFYKLIFLVQSTSDRLINKFYYFYFQDSSTMVRTVWIENFGLKKIVECGVYIFCYESTLYVDIDIANAVYLKKRRKPIFSLSRQNFIHCEL